ncbi:putative GTP-binding protein 6 [Thrips palmi]|uniref:GTP-binding protein 6 n=1 Tax=Thrips palmi TaxID=161013 RepID=A0A6P8YP21_THRPL|nr:putative GTP-binding protein 6 [Thrips palmi]
MHCATMQRLLYFPKLLSALKQQVKFGTRPGYVCPQKNILEGFQQVRRYSDEWDYDVEKVLQDADFDEFSDRMLRLPQHGHNVFVIQPFVRPFKKSAIKNEMVQEAALTSPQLQLEEALALINTLPRWKAVDSIILGVNHFKSSTFFGSGQIDRLKNIVGQSKNISAVFVNVDILRVKQIIELELALKVPVFDRYTIVIQIFRHHAVTKESKLQIALAEIPYLKQCVKGFPKGLSDRLASGRFVGGTEGMLPETRKELLSQREQKLKKAVSFLKQHRQRVRNDPKNIYPIVAVMGYTNAGKTSLIKALTGTEKLEPRNQLFATLDVTKHKGNLPCSLEVLYVDTVGFITDIPTELFESFTATLEDAAHANVILHVWDVSNPDFRKQQEHVMKTLLSLNFGENLEKRLFVVGNKVDRISENELSDLKKAQPNTCFVSTKTGFGMEEMLHKLEKLTLQASGRTRIKLRVKAYGEEFEWIRRELPVEDMQLDSEYKYAIFTVLVLRSQLEIFKHKFVKKNNVG